MNEKDLTTYCGLYCGDCSRYQSKFPDLANDLLNEFEKISFSEFAKLYGFEHYDNVISLLKVLPGLKCETLVDWDKKVQLESVKSRNA